MSLLAVASLLVALIGGCSDGTEYSPRPVVTSYYTVWFGASLPLSGPAAAEGQAREYAYAQMRRHINGSGGIDIGGRRCLVSLEVLDDGGDAAKRTANVALLANERAVDLLLGTSPDSDEAPTAGTVEERPVIHGDPPRITPPDGWCEGDAGRVPASPSPQVCESREALSAAVEFTAYVVAIERAGSLSWDSLREELRALAAEQN